MPTNQKVSALIVVAMAGLGALYTLISGNQPLLGLDLQGGVSVVLEPTGSTDGSGATVNDESLDLTVELLRARIDEIGVAEPEISRQGENIVVGLPGLVEEQEEALARLRQTAELRFRPVLLNLGPELELELEDDADADADTGSVDSTDEDADTDADADADAEESFGVTGRSGPVVFPLDTTTTSEASDDDSEPAPDESDADADVDPDADPDAGDDEAPELDLDQALPDALSGCLSGAVTPDDDDLIDEVVVLTDDEGFRYCLGPAVLDGNRLTGDMIETADVGLTPGTGWQVNPTFNPGDEGIGRFNEIAAVCFLGNQDICPSRQLAVVLDHQVISAPAINAGSFNRDQIVISGSSQDPFEEEEARRLAEALRFGALPLELVAQETRTVSASIGQDVMRSGVIAGLIGLALVAIYLLAYYRLAGLVAISGLLLSAALLWTIIAWFGETFGLALSLAGVVGLIVSIGVSTDSNIVYFENVKDSYRAGRRVPTAVERAYESAISTIVKADVVSLIAAVLLYFLTVGAVRGFAFYLGLATILDLIISWMFMRPALAWLAKRSAVEENPTLLGLPATGGASE